MAMTMQDIKEYVARTVNNTNPNQLESMINAYVESSGGGGGGDDTHMKIVTLKITNNTTDAFKLAIPFASIPDMGQAAALSQGDVPPSSTTNFQVITYDRTGVGNINPTTNGTTYTYTPSGSIIINGDTTPKQTTGQVDIIIGANCTLVIDRITD